MTVTTTQEVAVCTETTVGGGGHVYGCVRAADHDTPCEFPADTKYGKPLDEFDVAWLASEVRMLHGQIESLKREIANNDDTRRYQRVVSRLIGLAPAGRTRKTVATADVQRIWQDAINGA